MSWEFICIIRRRFQSDDNWGEMFIKNEGNGEWEKICFTYELPWVTFESGSLKGKSKNSASRIKLSEYSLRPRSDGPKGWRLELENTAHRTNIQIHRAHKSMYIEGCILPVTFNNTSLNRLKKGDPQIQFQSIALMDKIKTRYEAMRKGKKGKPTVQIRAVLPAILDNGKVYA